MGRKHQPDRLEAVYQQVQEHPGERPGGIARRLGVHRSEITRVLPALEAQGYLLWEDDQGRLWPYPRKR